jgi:predicted signal transduction protein with EAL and GGDEF domain
MGTKRIEVTISIGLDAGAQGRGGDADVLKRADTALYCAKHDGRNRVVSPRRRSPDIKSRKQPMRQNTPCARLLYRFAAR